MHNYPETVIVEAQKILCEHNHDLVVLKDNNILMLVNKEGRFVVTIPDKNVEGFLIATLINDGVDVIENVTSHAPYYPCADQS